jgi:hypothetical protein
MVHMSVIEARMSQLGIKISRWFSAEIKELQHILEDQEKIVALVPGRYFGGYALLIATDHRVLLIDKRTFFLTLEDVRYDMISEINFTSRVFDSTIEIFTMNKQHRFSTTRYKRHLRVLATFVQQQLMQLRQAKNASLGGSSINAQVQHDSSLNPSQGPPQPALVAATNDTSTHVPLREAYPTRAVQPANPSPTMRFALPANRNFNKFGNLAIRSAHRFSPHAHIPHPHLPHLAGPHKSGVQNVPPALDF